MSTNKDGMKSVNYDKLVAPIIEGIKEQQNQIKEQKNKIDLLEAKITEISDIKTRLQQLEQK